MLKKLLRPILLALTIFTLYLNISSAQIPLFALRAGGSSNEQSNAIATDKEGNNYIAGYYYGTAIFDTVSITSTGLQEIFVAKYNSNGKLLWAKSAGGTSDDDAIGICVDNKGNCYLTGYASASAYFDTFIISQQGGFIAKYDRDGNVNWAQQVSSLPGIVGESLFCDKSDNIYLAGEFQNNPFIGSHQITSNGSTDIFIAKCDTNGFWLWASSFGNTFSANAFSVYADSYGNGYVTGEMQNQPGWMQSVAAKYNPTLSAFEWIKQTSDFESRGVDICVDTNGNSYYTGQFSGYSITFDGFTLANTDSGHLEIFFVKLDSTGNTVWAQSFGGYGIDGDFPRSIAIDNQDNIFLSGQFYQDLTIGFDTFNLSFGGDFLSKFHSDGYPFWTTLISVNIPNNSSIANGFSLDNTGNPTLTGQFIGNVTIGNNSLTSSGAGDIFVCKLYDDTHGYTKKITGKVYADKDNDCVFAGADFGLQKYLVRATPGPYYGLSKDSGNYVIYIDTGTYVVEQIPKSNLWNQNCQLQYNVALSALQDSIVNIDFSDTANYYCSKLWVDIGTQGLRANASSDYRIKYSNVGTSTAINCYIDATFDNCIVPVSSSIPWTVIGTNLFRFNVGDLYPEQSGEFIVTASVCGIGSSTHCISAKIFPDEKCYLTDSAYDRRQVYVIGECLGNDSIEFLIKNVNSLGYPQHGFAKFFVNNYYAEQDTFNLNPGDSIIIIYPANGNTIRCELYLQNFPVPPVYNGTQVTIEGCGLTPVFGQIGQLPENDHDLNFELDCKTITGSFDPNEKLVQPIGLTMMHYTAPNQELEYQINFQNVGTDTAFNILIRDTLSPFLDVASLQSGVSSHQYQFNIYGNGIAEWKFFNINLPDSNVDEAGSHGFVKFKIQQILNNLPGTVINNSASIYFDFNSPVITNITENIVLDTVLVNTGLNSISDELDIFIIHPNPTSDETTLSYSLHSNAHIKIELLNVLGQKISVVKNENQGVGKHQLKINSVKEELVSGIYFVKLIVDDKVVVRKLVVE